jgi:hypothetical protein
MGWKREDFFALNFSSTKNEWCVILIFMKNIPMTNNLLRLNGLLLQLRELATEGVRF